MRCGREGVPADAALCELCNPLELAQPSATQMHGIAAVGILAFVLILALVARLAFAGTGPFTASVAALVPAADGLSLTVSVENEGTNASATSCEVREAAPRLGAKVEVIQTPSIPGGQAVEFTRVVRSFGTEPLELVVRCGRG